MSASAMATPEGHGGLSSRVRQETWHASSRAMRADGLHDDIQYGPSLLPKAADHGEHALHEARNLQAVRTEAALAPQDRRADVLLARDVGGFDS